MALMQVQICDNKLVQARKAIAKMHDAEATSTNLQSQLAVLGQALKGQQQLVASLQAACDKASQGLS